MIAQCKEHIKQIKSNKMSIELNNVTNCTSVGYTCIKGSHFIWGTDSFFSKPPFCLLPDRDITGGTDRHPRDSWHIISRFEDGRLTLLGSNSIDASWVSWGPHLWASRSSRGRGLNFGGEGLGCWGSWRSPYPRFGGWGWSLSYKEK